MRVVVCVPFKIIQLCVTAKVLLAVSRCAYAAVLPAQLPSESVSEMHASCSHTRLFWLVTEQGRQSGPGCNEELRANEPLHNCN